MIIQGHDGSPFYDDCSYNKIERLCPHFIDCAVKSFSIAIRRRF